MLFLRRPIRVVTLLPVAALAALVFADATGGASVESADVLPSLRIAPVATTLPDGRVAVLGGHGDGFDALAGGDVWTEGEGWTAITGGTPHDIGGFARLADGRYLLAGGAMDYGIAPGYANADIWDPAGTTMTPTGSLNYARCGAHASRLADGRVLVAGGWYDDTSATYPEIYDPDTGTFSVTGALSYARSYPLTVPTNDGGALVLGGYGPYGGGVFEFVESWSPVTNSFTVLQSSLFDGESGWYAGTQLTHEIDAQRGADGRFVLLAYNGDYQYRIFTVDPATKALESVALSAPLSEECYYIGPIMDPTGTIAYLVGQKRDDQNLWRVVAVDLTSGAVTDPGDWLTPPNDQHFSNGGVATLLDGRIGFAGGYIRSNVSNFTGSNQWTLLSPYVRGAVVAPEAPTLPTVMIAGPDAARIEWGDISASESGFRIERRTLPDGEWNSVGTASRNVTSFMDEGLVRGATYAWHVCAYNAAGDSAWTDAVDAKAPAGRLVAPAALSFGAVKQGHTKTLYLTVRNTDKSDALYVGVGSVTGDFKWGLQESGVVIEPGKRVRIPVQFIPDGRGVRKGTLSLETSASAKPTWSIKLKGVGRK